MLLRNKRIDSLFTICVPLSYEMLYHRELKCVHIRDFKCCIAASSFSEFVVRNLKVDAVVI
jgi:hypothetical protein